jgi:SAM-dependent methyltransferase
MKTANKAKNKKNEAMRGPDAKEFLRILGIEKTSEERVRSAIARHLRERGHEYEEVFSVEMAFVPDQGDILFSDEAIGLTVLSSSYTRYEKVMRDLASGSVLPTSPARIVDCGCGPGVLTLWIAKIFPHAEVIGIDYSRGCVRMAERLRDKAGVDNVRFIHGSYTERHFVDSFGRFSAVLNLQGMLVNELMMDGSVEEGYGAFSYREVEDETIESVSPSIAGHFQSMAELLEDEGRLVASPSGLMPWDFLAILHGARKAGLGVDWSRTRWHSPDSDAPPLLVFGRPVPCLTSSAASDLSALLALDSGGFRDTKLTEFNLDAYQGLFADGQVLLEAIFAFFTGGRERIRIVEKCGLLMVEQTTTRGMRQGFLTSVGNIEKAMRFGFDRIQVLASAGSGEFCKIETTRELGAYAMSTGFAEVRSVSEDELARMRQGSLQQRP